MLTSIFAQIDDIGEPYPARLVICCAALFVLVTAGLFYRSWAMKKGYEAPITCLLLCGASLAWMPIDRNVVVHSCILTVGFIAFWAMVNLIFRRKKDARV